MIERIGLNKQKRKIMNIDWSTNSTEKWKTTFERYITGGNGLGSVMDGGNESVERWFKGCLPLDIYPDRQIQKVSSGWEISGTHPVGGPFLLVLDKVNKTTNFQWL